MNFSEIPLFDNIPDSDCRRMMSCFQAVFISLHADQEFDIRRYFQHDTGIVLSGSVEISRIDFSGRKSILEIIEKNEIFGRLYSYAPEESDTITAKCLKAADIAFLPNEHIQQQCGNCVHCPRAVLISNLLELMSKKTNTLSARVSILSQRTIREKLLDYFYQLSRCGEAATGSYPSVQYDNSGGLPLYVDRSAMTRELRNTKNDGLIAGDGKKIHLLM